MGNFNFGLLAKHLEEINQKIDEREIEEAQELLHAVISEVNIKAIQSNRTRKESK